MTTAVEIKFDILQAVILILIALLSGEEKICPKHSPNHKNRLFADRGKVCRRQASQNRYLT
jgi:hypothetical protein